MEQHDVGQFSGPHPPVVRPVAMRSVSEDGVTQVLEVQADLVKTSGHRSAFQQAESGRVVSRHGLGELHFLEHFDQRLGRLGLRVVAGRQGLGDFTFLFGKPTSHHRVVPFLHRTFHQHVMERGMRLSLASKHHDARRRTVQPVNGLQIAGFTALYQAIFEVVGILRC